MAQDRILINRAPVLTFWAATVAERLDFDRDEAISLGKAVAGLTAQSKVRWLGIFAPTPEALKKHAKQNARRNSGLRFLVATCRRIPKRRKVCLRASPRAV